MRDFLNQWSTIRGFVVLLAVTAGVTNPVLGAGMAVIDHVPELALSVLGLAEVVRNGKKEPVVKTRGRGGH